MGSIGRNVGVQATMLPSDGVEWNAKVNDEEVSVFIESNAILLDARTVSGAWGPAYAIWGPAGAVLY